MDIASGSRKRKDGPVWHAVRMAIPNVVGRTLPLSLLAWCGVELLRACTRRRELRWGEAGLRLLAVWSLAMFLSLPADSGVWNPVPTVYLAVFALGVLAWLAVTVFQAVWGRKRDGGRR